MFFLTAIGMFFSQACFATDDNGYQNTFTAQKEDFASRGKNKYFILEPGFQLVLEGRSNDQPTVLTITVLDETKRVDGVETRVLEEKEAVNGKVEEISRNYYAISKKTRDIYYFGEEVDNYKDGKVDNHDGSWLAGVKEAHFGLYMPANPIVGQKYDQELAPGIAMDRGEIVSLTESFETPAGKFDHCLRTKDTSGLDGDFEEKHYAPDIGLIQDEGLLLTRYGQTKL